MPEAGVPPAIRRQTEEERRPGEDGLWNIYVSNSLSSAYVIAVLRMPGVACQAALYEIYPLAYGTWTQPVSYRACVTVLVAGKQGHTTY